MESDGLRRSPRRCTSRSRVGGAASSKPADSTYDHMKVAELVVELEARGIKAPSKTIKRDLCHLLVENDELNRGDSNNGVLAGESANGTSQKNMIPLSLSSSEREHYQQQHQTSTTAGNGSAVSDTDRSNLDSLVLWKQPIATSYYFLAESRYQLGQLARYMATRWQIVLILGLITAAFGIASSIEGPHSPLVLSLRSSFLWYGWWVGLGILSSVGLGTGLHTFLLYLGPHIAAVTLASWSCMSVDFPSPPYPDQIVCPEGSPAAGAVMSIWMIISKVRWESMAWGAGTAIGELPPYFVARAARLAGQEMDPELEEAMSDADTSFAGKTKHFVHRLIKRVGFWGIFLAASIPNPLFDLAGITCGHFLVPFPTFFGATLLGKAVVKMHLQKILVVFLFTKSHFEALIDLIGKIPSVGSHIQKPFVEFLEKQKAKYHQTGGASNAEDGSLIQYCYGLLVIGMISYFLLSIVNSMARQNATRSQDNKSK